MNIDWNPPKPRSGHLGQWDAFVGPGATNAEEWIQLVLGALVAIVCVTLFLTKQAGDVIWYHYLVVGFLALDIGGGIVTNATNSAKRWYHRAGYSRKKHLLFVGAHAIHLGVIALVFSSNPLVYFVLTFGAIILASVLVVFVPLYLQRPAAFGTAAILIPLCNLPVFSILGLEWFLPLMILKLLLGHLVKEAPFRPEGAK